MEFRPQGGKSKVGLSFLKDRDKPKGILIIR